MASLSRILMTAGIGLSTLVATTSASRAADMLAPDMRPALIDWTGLYVGGFGGVGCLEANYQPPYASLDPNMAGCVGLAGIYGGYDYQIGSFVLGFEGDYGWTFDGHLAFAGGEEETNYSPDALRTAPRPLGWLGGAGPPRFLARGARRGRTPLP